MGYSAGLHEPIALYTSTYQPVSKILVNTVCAPVLQFAMQYLEEMVDAMYALLGCQRIMQDASFEMVSVAINADTLFTWHDIYLTCSN